MPEGWKKRERSHREHNNPTDEFIRLMENVLTRTGQKKRKKGDKGNQRKKKGGVITTTKRRTVCYRPVPVFPALSGGRSKKRNGSEPVETSVSIRDRLSRERRSGSNNNLWTLGLADCTLGGMGKFFAASEK